MPVYHALWPSQLLSQALSGQNFGYDAFSDRTENTEAIDKWWAWWQENRPK